jgi:hypothetical protein
MPGDRLSVDCRLRSAFRGRGFPFAVYVEVAPRVKSVKGLSDSAIERVEVREVTAYSLTQALDAATSELLHGV